MYSQALLLLLFFPAQLSNKRREILLNIALVVMITTQINSSYNLADEVSERVQQSCGTIVTSAHCPYYRFQREWHNALS